ncbi:MAG: DUF933 domain-containing protein [Elusimicrobia bacterium]|nr:DUF933 domain-containing protein [Elusimicrobiota bacterium]
MNCGIIGLPNVGKTALFNLLTENNAKSSNYPYCTVEPNVGVAHVRDPRIDTLKEKVYRQAVLTYPYIKFVDVAGLPPGASRGEGLGNQFLSNIRDVYCILHVVRDFKSEDVSIVEGAGAGIESDISLVETELFLSDLEIAQRRHKENPMSEYWKKAAELLSGNAPPPPDSDGILLTPKEQILLVNITTGADRPDIKRDNVIFMDVAFQTELGQMAPEERRSFLDEMPGWESGSGDVLFRVKELLGQVTFFTVVGGREIKGYNVKKGTSVYEAAGKIHKDMQKGFVRARVYGYRDLEVAGFDAEALKKTGKVRTEGREYEIRDGDIIEILFSQP